ncbi:Gldg family protein [[Ruminococcus] lactaris]|uniref:Gldg family protein n=1 Tax=[Ruminococcus] lactaris TaxID=46228 RepID=UPI003FD77416
MFHTSGTKHGSYSVGMTVLVVAVMIVFNLVVGQIPEAYRNIDVSSTKIYDISDTSKDLLKGLDDKIDMKVLAVKDETDDRITTFISKYAALSDKIKVEWIDPVLHPSALTEYNTSQNTIYVSCEATGKSTTISFDKILVSDSSSYYYSGSSSYTSFDGEGQLSSAVNYVTSDVQKKIYTVTGHGEDSLSTTITDLMTKNNYTTEELNLLMTDSIPDDCDLLLMDGPTNDLSDDEVSLLSGYLGEGGKVMCLLGDTGLASLPKLAGLLKDYGIEGADGYIADPQRCYQNQPYYIFPVMNLSGDMADGISSQMVLLMNSRGLTTTDPARDTITTSAFMTTSEQAYAVTEEDQKQGTYDLGVVATETISSDSDSSDDTSSDSDSSTDTSSDDSTESKESRLTVISAGSLIDQQITDAFSQLENTQVFMNAVTANFEGVTNLSIEAKSLTTEYNTVQHAGGFSILVVFGIPAVVLIGGFVVWFRRRKA